MTKKYVVFPNRVNSDVQNAIQEVTVAPGESVSSKVQTSDYHHVYETFTDALDSLVRPQRANIERSQHNIASLSCFSLNADDNIVFNQAAYNRLDKDYWTPEVLKCQQDT